MVIAKITLNYFLVQFCRVCERSMLSSKLEIEPYKLNLHLEKKRFAEKRDFQLTI